MLNINTGMQGINTERASLCYIDTIVSTISLSYLLSFTSFDDSRCTHTAPYRHM